MQRRNFLGGAVALFGSSRLRAQSGTAANAQLARSIADAANSVLSVFRPELRRQLEFAFDDPERKDWSNVPHFVHPRKGARFGDFNPQERAAAHGLLQTILSSQGYDKALAIMERDEFLASTRGPGIPAKRNSARSSIFWMYSASLEETPRGACSSTGTTVR